jgi:hypothetical protein
VEAAVSFFSRRMAGFTRGAREKEITGRLDFEIDVELERD